MIKEEYLHNFDFRGIVHTDINSMNIFCITFWFEAITVCHDINNA